MGKKKKKKKVPSRHRHAYEYVLPPSPINEFVVCIFVCLFCRACTLVTLSRRHVVTATQRHYPPTPQIVNFLSKDALLLLTPNFFSMGYVFLCTNFNLKTVSGKNQEIF